MSFSSPSVLSATASAFVPYSSQPAAKEEAPTRQKKTREMRGPRKRHKKMKSDNCSVSTSITEGDRGDGGYGGDKGDWGEGEDDEMSYLSLEASYPIGMEYYDNEYENNSFSASQLNQNSLSSRNPLFRKKWAGNPNHYKAPDKNYQQYDHYDAHGQQHAQYGQGNGQYIQQSGQYTQQYSDLSAFPDGFDSEYDPGSQVLIEDWSVWFDKVVDQFGRSDSPDSQSHSYFFTNPREHRHKRTPSECSQDSHGQWLDLQQVRAKNILF